jgi:hypothetical protein
MIPRLHDYLNQNILVSIPVLNSDIKCRPYTLLGAELHGLWLQSEELTDLATTEESDVPAAGAPVFVAFSHIAFVVLPPPVRKIAGFPASLRAEPSAAAHAQALVGRAAERKRTRDSEAPGPKKRGK